jgi:uncharacterized protein
MRDRKPSRLEQKMASNPQHEPTMEEILASIRKIISEDSSSEPPPAPVQAAPPPEPVKAAAEPEVLELTQAIEEPPPAPPATKPADEIIFQTIEETAVAPAQAHSSEGIFSDKTRKVLDDAFANLEPAEEAPAAKPAAGPLPSVEGVSVEAVFNRAVRETFDPVLGKWLGDNADSIVDRMKPVIREWLDEHFPAMLEEAVRAEVARAVKPRKR